uniref:Uncharacterized protein n=1 Tax=Ditylenchus dipsaci TaxID=166011 RepID=A0A915CV33_9BILA
MTRHGKNATASSVYSYKERQKDAYQSGYGTLHGVWPCREPLISPHGYIFDKNLFSATFWTRRKVSNARCIVLSKFFNKYITIEIAQERRGAKRKVYFVGDYAAHLKILETPSSSSRALKRRFSGEEELPASSSKKKESSSLLSVSNMAGEKAKQWNSFWVPELIKTAEPTKVEKPSENTLPIKWKPLKYKDLMPVKFTPIDSQEASGKITPNGRSDLTIKFVGHVRPHFWKAHGRSDIIELQRGGTGYSATNDVQAKLIRPQLEIC